MQPIVSGMEVGESARVFSATNYDTLSPERVMGDETILLPDQRTDCRKSRRQMLRQPERWRVGKSNTSHHKPMSEPNTGHGAIGDVRGSLTSPTSILRSAIEAVPAVKFALGVAGVISAIALVKGFFSSAGAALLAGFGMLILMTLLVLFAATAKARSGLLIVPAMVFTWALLLLVIGSSILIVSSAFFEWPKPLSALLQWASSTAPRLQTGATEHVLRGIRLSNGAEFLKPGSKAIVQQHQPLIFEWDNLPQHKEAWLAVYSNALHRYFPQSCIKTAAAPRELSCIIEIGGEADAGERFEIVVIEADEGAQRDLSRYLSQVDRSGLDQVPNGAEVLYTITVVRR